MENMTQMRKRHEKEVSSLQKKCKHKKISDWTPFAWAPGHYGLPVKYCLFCEKTIEKSEVKFSPIDEACSTQKLGE